MSEKLVDVLKRINQNLIVLSVPERNRESQRQYFEFKNGYYKYLRERLEMELNIEDLSEGTEEYNSLKSRIDTTKTLEEVYHTEMIKLQNNPAVTICGDVV